MKRFGTLILTALVALVALPAFAQTAPAAPPAPPAAPPPAPPAAGTLAASTAKTKMSIVDVLVVGPDGDVGDNEVAFGDITAGELMYRYPRGGMPVMVHVKLKSVTDEKIVGTFRGLSAGRLVFAGGFTLDNTKKLEDLSDDLGDSFDGWVPTQLKNQAPKSAGGGHYSAKLGRAIPPASSIASRRAPKPARKRPATTAHK